MEGRFFMEKTGRGFSKIKKFGRATLYAAAWKSWRPTGGVVVSIVDKTDNIINSTDNL